MAKVERRSQREIHRLTGSTAPPSVARSPHTSRRATGRGRSAPRSSVPSSVRSSDCSTRSRCSRASASARRSKSSATAAARRSSTISCASSVPATCHRRASTSAPSTNPASWPSSTSPSPARDPGRLGSAAQGLSRHLQAALLARLCRRPGLLEGVSRHCLGMSRCLERLGAAAGKALLHREGAIAPRGQPTEPVPRLLRPARAGLDRPRRRRLPGQGALERDHRFCSRQLRGRRCFANPAHFQDQLDRWCDRINQRKHRSTRAIVCERLASEHERMRPLPEAMPSTDRAGPAVPSQPYPRFDRNDYSLHPRLVGRRVGSAPPKPRSSPSPSTAASSPLATAGSSPAGSPSPIPPTWPRSRSRAVSASDAVESPRSRSGPWPATMPYPGMSKISELTHLFRP